MNIFRGSKKLLVGLGVAGCSATAAVLFGLSNESTYSVKAASLLPDNIYSHFMPLNNPIPANGTIKWDENWDMRSPQFSGRFGENASAKKEERAAATATRHLILLRHGQYNTSAKNDDERYLTSLGREQAKYAGIRLRELGITFDRIVQSTMIRAKETAEIVAKELPAGIKIDSCELLREGAPVVPEPPSNWSTPEKFFRDGPRIEAAFRRYFYRASPEQQKDSYELIACHANVIRYFVCRALQFPPEAWLRFCLHHCSLTWIAIRPSGRVTVFFIGDTGHVPPSKMTYY